jgi:hypothetical protein
MDHLNRYINQQHKHEQQYSNGGHSTLSAGGVWFKSRQRHNYPDLNIYAFPQSLQENSGIIDYIILKVLFSTYFPIHCHPIIRRCIFCDLRVRAVAQLVEALLYKPERRGFDSR